MGVDTVPTCDGCGAPGYYGVCHDCQTRDHEVEPRNNHVTTGHNRYNVPTWS